MTFTAQNLCVVGFPKPPEDRFLEISISAATQRMSLPPSASYLYPLLGDLEAGSTLSDVLKCVLCSNLKGNDFSVFNIPVSFRILFNPWQLISLYYNILLLLMILYNNISLAFVSQLAPNIELVLGMGFEDWFDQDFGLSAVLKFLPVGNVLLVTNDMKEMTL